MGIKRSTLFNVVVIGGGPAGLFTTIELNKNGIKTLLIERSNKIGGIAFNNDVNLQASDGSSRKTSFYKRILGSNKVGDDLILYVYELLYKFGLPKEKCLLKQTKNMKIDNKLTNEGLKYVYTDTLALRKKLLRNILNNILSYLNRNNYTEFLMNTSVINIKRGKKKRWRILLNKPEIIEADDVALCTGKFSVLWLLEVLDSVQISYENNPNISIGVRLEGKAKLLNKIVPNCLNPKIKLVDKNSVTESFCWCKNGGVISFNFCGANVLDGKHLHGKPSDNTSFGIIVTIKLPKNSSNTYFGINLSKHINSLGNGKVLLQTLGDFKKRKTTTIKALKKNSVNPSLKTFKLANIRAHYPPLISDRILKLIAGINKTYSNVITDDCLLYAPVVERVFPDIYLSKNLESSQRGIFLAGDCSGKAIGVMPACTMGIAVAQYITEKLKKRNKIKTVTVLTK